MANITNVNYEAMPRQAKQMREYAKELNQELKLAYSQVGEMHNSWYGTRYNELVKNFNDMIPELNKLLALVVTDIPYALEKIANNYAQADKGQNVTSAEEVAPDKIANLAIKNDVGMKFLTNEVSSVQKKVSDCFQKSKDLMNKVETEFGKVEWKSEASETFKSTLKKLKTSIISSFDNINTQFTKLMNQTQQDIENAEKSNTVQ